MFVLVRSRSDAGSLAARLKDEVAALDANLPLDRVRTMAEVIWNARWNARLSYRLILTLTLIAAVLVPKEEKLLRTGMLVYAFAVVAETPEEVAAQLGARFDGAVSRLSFYAPYKSDPERWAGVLADLKRL